MKKRLLLFACCLALASAYAQSGTEQQTTAASVSENIATHRVLMGETVSLLAKKYKMTPQDIYEYNPAAVDGISANMFLKIPLHRQVDLTAPKKEEVPVVYRKKEAEVVGRSKPAELTPSSNSIAQTSNTQPAPQVQPAPVSKPIEVARPVVEVAVATPVVETVLQPVTHKVQYGETLYSLARKYGVSLSDLTAANKKALKHGLQSGQTLVIPPGANEVVPSNQEAVADLPVTEAVVTEDAPAIAEVESIEHKVENGETLTGLAQKYHTTIDAITAANKARLRHGLQVGQIIKIKPNTTNH